MEKTGLIFWLNKNNETAIRMDSIWRNSRTEYVLALYDKKGNWVSDNNSISQDRKEVEKEGDKLSMRLFRHVKRM